MSAEDTIIPFGKHSGTRIGDVPDTYLQYLACWDVKVARDAIFEAPSLFDATVSHAKRTRQDWVWNNHRDIVNDARTVCRGRGMKSSTLTFGQHRGTTVTDVDFEYLKYLCSMHVIMEHYCNCSLSADAASRDDDASDCECECPSYAIRYKLEIKDDEESWVFKNAPRFVLIARKELVLRHRCWECGRALVPIGEARSNGACHPDWDSRILHKKCYKDKHVFHASW